MGEFGVLLKNPTMGNLPVPCTLYSADGEGQNVEGVPILSPSPLKSAKLRSVRQRFICRRSRAETLRRLPHVVSRCREFEVRYGPVPASTPPVLALRSRLAAFELPPGSCLAPHEPSPRRSPEAL